MALDAFVGPLSPTCSFTVDANQNVIMGAGCTASDLFVDAPNGDFHLVPTAPAIGRAVCLPEVQVDFDGNPRPTPGRPPGFGCDIGAYQYTGATLPLQPPTDLKVLSIEP